MKLVLLLFLVLITSRAFGAFGYQSAVTVDHTKVPSTQTDFPVLISITDARFKTTGNGGHVGNANGYDIRPHSDTACSAALNYELERYNASTGEVIMWVKIASLSSSVDTVFRLAYGDAGITTDGSSTAVWSNSFKYVVHTENGTTLSLTDSLGITTVNNNNTVTAAAGEIDGAANFVSSSSQSFEGASAGAFTDPAQTWSAWVRPTTLTGAEHTIIGQGFGGNEYGVIAVKTNGKLRTNFLATAYLGYDGTGSITLSTNTWYYVVMTYSSSAGMVVYVNNSVDQTVSPNGALYTAVAIAGQAGGNRGTGNRYWDGQIDEVRTASVVRSADWLTTEYNNQSSPSTFETLASEQIGCPLTALERSYGYIDGVFSIK